MSPGHRQRPKEIFAGPRLRAAVAPSLRARSALALVLLCVVLGAMLAAALAAGIDFVVQAVTHAFGTGS